MLDVLEYHINNEKFRNNIIASLMNVHITIIIHDIYNSISIPGKLCPLNYLNDKSTNFPLTNISNEI
jgi:hypothetical protein